MTFTEARQQSTRKPVTSLVDGDMVYSCTHECFLFVTEVTPCNGVIRLKIGGLLNWCRDTDTEYVKN